MTAELVQQEVSEKERRLAAAYAALDDKEKGAYRYFVKTGQAPLVEETSDELFQLFLRGSTCDEIRKARPGFGLGQIVACRVIHNWDLRRREYRDGLKQTVPDRAGQVYLEQADFLGDILTATMLVHRDNIRQYMATGDKTFLKDVPIPSSVKDLRDFTDLFMKITGQDKKKVEISGSVTIDSKTGLANQVTSKEAMSIMSEVLGEEIQDAEFTEGPKVTEADPFKLEDGTPVPQTAEEMVAYLVSTGVPDEKAKSFVDSMGGDKKRYLDLMMTLRK